jgi:hypothetical protein
MDIKQFLSWNLTAVPCARLSELTRTGTADPIGLAVLRGRPGHARKSLEPSRTIEVLNFLILDAPC